MRAITIEQYGGAEVLGVRQVPLPEPGPGEVRIRVGAAAVNPVDHVTRAGYLSPLSDSLGFPMVLGWDVAGAIDALGDGVTGWSAGDRVVAMSSQPVTGRGTQAESVVLDASAIARAPRTADTPAASSLPLAALTAVQALDAMALEPRASVLVTGAAGAVGGFATQLAADRGHLVVASVAANDGADVRRLGAKLVVDREGDVTRQVRQVLPGGVDAALDAGVAGVIGAVRDGGAFIAVVPAGLVPPERGIAAQVMQVVEDGTQLAALVDLVDVGRLALRVAHVLPFERAAEAYALVERGGQRGKVVLVP